MNFEIRSGGSISGLFRKNGITSFVDACKYVQHLPYKRNANKYDVTTVLSDGHGTCSTKHALLKRLAEENTDTEVKLILGIFKMNGINTPLVRATLAKHQLPYIPEAHNYLMIGGERLDFTKVNFGVDNFVNGLVEETEIGPEQITDFKVSYHKEFIKEWLQDEPGIPFTFEELWEIREQCIRDLSS